MKSVLKLLVWLKPYRLAAWLAPAFILGEVLMDLVIPSLIRSMIDVGVASGDFSYILRRGLAMMGAAVLGLVAGLLSNYYSAVVSQSVGADLRSAVFRKVHSLSFANMDRFETGQLITRGTNDINQIQHLLQMGLKMIARAPFLLIGALLMAISTSPSLAVILLVMMPVMTVGIMMIATRAFPGFTRMQEKMDRLNTAIGENLSGIRVVKAFGRASYEEKRFGEANDDLFRSSVRAFNTVALITPLIMVVSNGGIVAALWRGGLLYGDGGVQIGQIQAFINYLSLIVFSLMMLAMTFMMISRAEASAGRIVEVLETEPLIRNSVKAPEDFRLRGAVEFRNVSFSYDGSMEDPVLRDISFSVEPGQTVAILGPTGAGKTSLVNLIPRFYDVTQGTVLLDGDDVRELDAEAIRRGMGFVLQRAILFSGSIADNIRFGRPEASREEVEAAARAAGAHEFIVEMKDGYESLVGEKGVNLSGGQKQRISIARALIRRPAILILDDSTSAVDVETEIRIQDALKEILPESTRFIIAQRISTVLEADIILVLSDGQVVESGTHQKLMQEGSLYRSIFESQLGGDMDE